MNNLLIEMDSIDKRIAREEEQDEPNHRTLSDLFRSKIHLLVLICAHSGISLTSKPVAAANSTTPAAPMISSTAYATLCEHLAAVTACDPRDAAAYMHEQVVGIGTKEEALRLIRGWVAAGLLSEDPDEFDGERFIAKPGYFNE